METEGVGANINTLSNLDVLTVAVVLVQLMLVQDKALPGVAGGWYTALGQVVIEVSERSRNLGTGRGPPPAARLTPPCPQIDTTQGRYPGDSLLVRTLVVLALCRHLSSRRLQ